MKFTIRPTQDILNDIESYTQYYQGQEHFFRSCFLQDGDALNIPTQDLLQILHLLKKHFPALRTITTYARADSILEKSQDELDALADAGLNHLYRGIETGSDTILKNIHKGITSNDIITSGLMAKTAGMMLSEFMPQNLRQLILRLYAEATRGFGELCSA